MNGTRRRFFQDTAILGAGLLGLGREVRAEEEHPGPKSPPATGTRPVAERGAYLPMVTPDLADLPHEMDGGTKVFHLVAEPVKRKIVPFKTIDAWGYNGSCPWADDSSAAGRPCPRGS